MPGSPSGSPLATDSPCLPAPESLILKFVLWDPAKREEDPQHGMLDDVTVVLKAEKLSKVSGARMRPSSVRRRLANWNTLMRCRGLEGFASLCVRPSAEAAQEPSAGTASALLKLLATCETDRLRGRRLRQRCCKRCSIHDDDGPPQ